MLSLGNKSSNPSDPLLHQLKWSLVDHYTRFNTVNFTKKDFPPRRVVQYFTVYILLSFHYMCTCEDFNSLPKTWTSKNERRDKTITGGWGEFIPASSGGRQIHNWFKNKKFQIMISPHCILYTVPAESIHPLPHWVFTFRSESLQNYN